MDPGEFANVMHLMRDREILQAEKFISFLTTSLLIILFTVQRNSPHRRFQSMAGDECE